ncbi:MAG: GNAT family N-acetyltransferase [Firmicutes bacterium]|nr:GNAT family N-acetyltransferase [Bacillota bacterium]
MKREIKPITPDYIEDYLTIYLNAYPAFKSVGDEGRDKYRPRILYSMENDKHIHFYGLFEDGKLIAQMKLIDFSMNAFGKMIKACGLMALGVHPMHKKKGAARDMVRFFEEYTRESGASVAMLLPFRIDFYRQMGYGYGSKMEEYRLPTINLPAADKEELKKLSFIGSDEAATNEILQCYSTFSEKNHGMCLKFEDEIRALDGDSDTRRVGYYKNGQLKGYVFFNFVCESDVNYTLNRMEVTELVYHSPEVLKTLLGFLRNQSDLAQTTVIRTGEPDFYHLLPSAQDTSNNYMDFGFLQTNVAAVGTMYKVVNLKEFIKSTSHRKFIPCKLTVKFDYESELYHTENSFAVAFGADGHWSIGNIEDSEVTVLCKLSDLSSLLMGSAEFSSLVRLGVIRISDESYVELLDTLFHCKQKPWTNTDY